MFVSHKLYLTIYSYIFLIKNWKFIRRNLKRDIVHNYSKVSDIFNSASMPHIMIVEYVLCSVVLFIQILGLRLLYRQKSLSRNKNQIYLLIALCHTATILAVLRILNLAKLLPTELLWFPEIYFRIFYHVLMVLFTLDRFLVFYFAIKYPLYCTSKKLLKIINTVVVLAIIFVLILVVLILCKVIHFWKLGIIVLHAVTIIDTLYIIDVVMTYTYIFLVYKRQAKLRKISNNVRINSKKFKFTVPTLVIITYILFTVFPHFWNFFMIIKSLDVNNLNSSSIFRILHILGWLADPLIYMSNFYLAKCKCQRR